MGTKDMIKKFIAGLFFMGCLAMVVVMVFLIGLDKGLTEQRFRMTVLFQKVGGLTPGAPVRLSGVTVGTVADISFLDQEVDGRGVQVHLNLYRKYEKQLHKSTRFAIITEGVLGDKIVEITTDPMFHREDLSKPVIGEDPLDVQNLAITFGEAAVALLETSESMRNLTVEVDDFSQKTHRLLNRIEKRIIDGTLFKVF